ncbi:MAG: TonB-dependent receptor [Bacteroidia bacterium]|nr:TonB-dependent receptor [Bacteroidia bacterium]NNJ81032.1 TonB-dependent receptor plug domain-containing protein [Flavobacteriaceae bacterium]NNK55557.1 TonB-dependent receptor plug domain-containing protein [Flavobacteriaceae bacterium]NNM08847.1 TonB-dependent receptor plug domain-containing protein [Flavobacteriaceae bacterium]
MPNSTNIRGILLTICWLVLVGQDLHSQTSEKQSLLTVLENLETTYDVRFSYSVEELDDITVEYSEQATLEASLEFLEGKLPFEFNRIDERYITVVKNSTDYLCGRILAADTGKPLASATVVSTLTSYGIVTNSDGSFYVPKYLLGEQLVIRYIGYQSWQIAVSDLTTDCETILIPAEVSTLDTVFISNYLVEGMEKSLDGSITINTSEFGLLPGQVENDILFVTQALPGVQSVNETISNINVRGGTHDENLILWNDIKAYQSGHFFGLISAFNPDITQDVKIYKNGAPVNYGDGISSVISMKSKDKVSSSASGGAGVNLINGSAYGIIPLSNKATLQVSGRSSLNGLWESPVYQTYSEKIFQDTEVTNTNPDETGIEVAAEERFSFYDFSTRLLWDLNDRDKFRLNFLALNNALEFDETIIETESSKNSELELRSLLGGISWERTWSESLSTKVLAYGTTYYLRALNKDLLTSQEVFQENDVLETGLKLDASLQFTNELSLFGGYQFIETGITNEQEVNLPRFVDFKKEVLRTHAAFAGLVYKSPSERTNIKAGLRLNYFTELDKFHVEPRLAFNQKLTEELSVEVIGEFRSQATTQRIDFDSDFLGVEKRRWVLANEENIPIITSQQASVGVIYESKGWLINLEGFYKNVEGITASNQGFQNQFQFERSTGSYLANGVEFAINKINKEYSVWFSYSYLNNQYEFDLFDPSEFPHNLDVTHAATIAGSYTFNRLKIATGINYRTGKPYTLPLMDNEITMEGLTEIVQYDEPNAERLPDYYRVDVSAEYLWQISDQVNAKINLAALNVLNTRNTLNTRFVVSQDANGDSVVNQVNTFSIGLSPNISFRVLF